VELEYYFDPVKAERRKAYQRSGEGRLGSSVSIIENGNAFAPEAADVAIIGVEAGVNSPGNKGCSKAPDEVRDGLYELRGFDHGLKVADLGNIRGKTANDKLIALTDVCSFLIANSVIPIVIGGSQDLTVALAAAAGRNIADFNLSVIDSAIDYSGDTDDLTSVSFLSKLFSDNKERLGNITMIGVQKYLYTSAEEEFIHRNYFDLIRLGELKGESIKNAEPYLRDTDILSLDVSSVKKTDMPAQPGAMPNGLISHEICQLAWYAGMSDRLKAFGMFELNPGEDDKSGSGVALAAQILWHFMEGISLRHNDYPVRDIDTYSIYIVHLEENGMDIRFFNNPQNGRWWVEVPGDENRLIVSCSEDDYNNALKNELSRRWIFFDKKSGSKSGIKDDSSADID